MWKHVVILIGLVMHLAGNAHAQVPVSSAATTKYPVVTSTLQPTSATVGQQLKYTVSVVAPELTRLSVKAPFTEGTATSWTLVGKPEVTDEQPGGGKESRRSIEYTIAAFDVGQISSPDVQISYQPPGGGEPVVRRVEPVTVTIHSVLPLEAAQVALRDIKPPVKLPYPKWLYWTAGLLFAAIVAAILWFAWRRARGRVGQLLRPQMALDAWALSEISRTESDRLIEQKKLKELYTRLSDTLRRYLGKLYNFPAWDMTSGELFFQLEDIEGEQLSKHVPAYREAITLCRGLFEEADMVKFAKYLPEPSKCRQAIERAREIVRLTRYKLDPEPEPAERRGSQGSAAGEVQPPPVPLSTSAEQKREPVFRPALTGSPARSESRSEL
jgi:hypothetical protein